MQLPATRTPPGFIDVGRPPSLPDYLGRMWRARDFIIFVPLGQLRAQTHNTILGSAWHLLNPLLNALLYYFVFGVLFQAVRSVENYATFLVIGIFTFLYTSRTILACARSMTGNLNLITQIRFPRAALPLSAVIAETISHAVAVTALLGMVVVLGEVPSIGWFAVVPIIALQMAFNLGMGFVVARLTFHYRDLTNFLPHALRFWMYLSGLFFTVELVVGRLGADSPLVTVFELNPAYIFMALMRGALMEQFTVGGEHVWHAAVWAVFILAAGFAFFRSREVEYSSG